MGLLLARVSQGVRLLSLMHHMRVVLSKSYDRES